MKIFKRLQSSEKLETLKVENCWYKEILVIPPETKYLQNLESLEVVMCRNLINVLPPLSSFSNLKIIKVHECHRLTSLMYASTVEGLVHLEEMKISNCEIMIQILEMEMKMDVEAKEITFKTLKKLELDGLISLRCFVSGNCSLDFPSLETLNIENCPTLEIFASGDLTLREVSLDKQKYYCNNDLDEIVRTHHKSEVWDFSFLLSSNNVASTNSLIIVMDAFGWYLLGQILVREKLCLHNIHPQTTSGLSNNHLVSLHIVQKKKKNLDLFS